jgi:hypothetical protein
VSAPPASSVTVPAGQPAQVERAGQGTREVALAWSLCEHSGQKTKARLEPARAVRGPSPARCGRSPDLPPHRRRTGRQQAQPGPSRSHSRHSATGSTGLRTERGRATGQQAGKGETNRRRRLAPLRAWRPPRRRSGRTAAEKLNCPPASRRHARSSRAHMSREWPGNYGHSPRAWPAFLQIIPRPRGVGLRQAHR